jgi:3-phenylpropionate/trans-cinnamate dioxygenase ferredoxin reductase component
VPWFWSDQFENKLLIVGLSTGYDERIVRAEPSSRGISVCYLKDERLIALDAVNHMKDYMAARKLMADRVRLRPEYLSDPTVPLMDARVS